MTWPREGAREIDEGIIVSEAMDWCNSPLEPVGYRIWAKQVDATNLAATVRQTDDRSHVKYSIVLKCYGDEPGIGGGVTSGTTGAECTPKTWSDTVFAEGRNMVRHDDDWWMNHKNTWGKLYYIKDNNKYEAEKPVTVDPLLQMRETIDSLPPGSDQYVALDPNAPAYSTPPGTISPTSQKLKASPDVEDPDLKPPIGVPAASTVIWGTLDGGIGLVGASRGNAVVEDAARSAANKSPVTRSPFMHLPLDIDTSVPNLGTRTTSNNKKKECKIEEYSKNTCVKGVEQAHHIVADTSMNVSGKALLSKDDGLTICLKGNAAPKGSPNGHSVAQTVYNAETQRAASLPGNDGTLSLELAEYWGAQSAYRGARADDPDTACTPVYIKNRLRDYHELKNLPEDTRVNPGTWN